MNSNRLIVQRVYEQGFAIAKALYYLDKGYTPEYVIELKREKILLEYLLGVPDLVEHFKKEIMGS